MRNQFSFVGRKMQLATREFLRDCSKQTLVGQKPGYFPVLCIPLHVLDTQQGTPTASCDGFETHNGRQDQKSKGGYSLIKAMELAMPIISCSMGFPF